MSEITLMDNKRKMGEVQKMEVAKQLTNMATEGRRKVRPSLLNKIY